MIENPLKILAATDRHAQPRWLCKDCGASVGTYNCNHSLISARPEGAGWDWWAACDNAECKNAEGEGYFQSSPDWTVNCAVS